MTIESISREYLYDADGRERRSGEGGYVGDCCPSTYCCFIGNCGGGGGGGKGDEVCAVIVLVLAVIAAAAAFFVSAGYTLSEGARSGEVCSKMEKVEQEAESDAKKNLLVLLKNDYRSATINAASLAVVTVGIGMLTVVAVIALYVYVKKIGSPQVMQKLAIAGGAIAGGGFLVMGLYHSINSLGYKKREEGIRYLRAQFPPRGDDRQARAEAEERRHQAEMARIYASTRQD